LPRIVQERLIGYRFEVAQSEEQLADPKDGKPLFHANGQPKTQTITWTAFIDDSTGHRVEIPFNEDGKQKFVQALTGGVVVPKLEVAT
jgi:hypothetical protein